MLVSTTVSASLGEGERGEREPAMGTVGDAGLSAAATRCTTKTQLDVRDEEEVVFHTLPSPKTRKKRKIHSLSDAVESTSQNEKRHKH